jgi:endo-1,4-beta-xylanase
MWVQNITDPEDLKSVMKGHIDAVLGRYGDKLAHMDVVNERKCLESVMILRLTRSFLGQWYIPRQCLAQPPWR